jgi:hypothetical protein
MTHDEAVLLVADLECGRLAASEAASVRTHLSECAECAGLAEAYRLLAAALRRDVGHPTSEELVESVMESPIRSDVQAHLASCAACSEQAAAIRRAEAESAPRRVAARAWIGWAAALLLPLSLGYAAWVHLHLLPGSRDAVRQAELTARGSPQALPLPLLGPALRSEEGLLVVPVDDGQHSIALAVAPALPADLPDAESLTIQLRGSEGAIRFAQETTAGELRRLTGRSGAFVLVFSASGLPDDEATLYIHAASRGELLATRFRLGRE